MAHDLCYTTMTMTKLTTNWDWNCTTTKQANVKGNDVETVYQSYYYDNFLCSYFIINACVLLFDIMKGKNICILLLDCLHGLTSTLTYILSSPLRIWYQKYIHMHISTCTHPPFHPSTHTHLNPPIHSYTSKLILHLHTHPARVYVCC